MRELQPGDRVRIKELAWLELFAGQEGTVAELNAGVEGRMRVRLDEPVGMFAHCDVHPHEVDLLPGPPDGD